MLGDDFGRAAGLSYQGLAQEESGTLPEAAASFRQAMEIHQRIGSLAYSMEARAGLARCALAEGRPGEALEHIQPVWEHLAEQAEAGMEFPVWAYLTCARVFRAAGSPEESRRAVAAGYRQLMERASRISEPAWRRSFLENVPENREIVAMWQEAGTPANP
jgi:hypothetical protein